MSTLWEKWINVNVTVVPIVGGAFGTFSEKLVKNFKKVMFGGMEIIQTTALLILARILKKILEKVRKLTVAISSVKVTCCERYKKIKESCRIVSSLGTVQKTVFWSYKPYGMHTNQNLYKKALATTRPCRWLNNPFPKDETLKASRYSIAIFMADVRTKCTFLCSTSSDLHKYATHHNTTHPYSRRVFHW